MITWKWHHYSKFLNRDLLEINQSEIENEANSSRTTKAWAMLNKPEDPFGGYLPRNADSQNPENADGQSHENPLSVKKFKFKSTRTLYQNPDTDIEMVNDHENLPELEDDFEMSNSSQDPL